MPGVSLKDIPSGEIKRDVYFDGKSLWGYIDGGADVYLEYGFSRLHLQEINYRKEHIKLEIYQMKNPEAAFGIFSVSRFKCLKEDSISRFHCLSSYQVQAARDRYYISAINDNGTPEEKALCKELVQVILNKIAQDSIKIPQLFLNELFQPYIGELKSFNGKLGVQNGFPAWSDQFDRYAKFSMYILPIENASNYAYLAKIRFSSSEDLKDFHTKAGFMTLSQALLSVSKNGVFKALKQTGPDELVYFETDFPDTKAEKFLKEID